MDPAIRQEIEILRKLKLKELKLRFRELFGERVAVFEPATLVPTNRLGIAGEIRRRSQRTRTPARRSSSEPRMWDLRLRAPTPVLANQPQQQRQLRSCASRSEASCRRNRVAAESYQG